MEPFKTEKKAGRIVKERKRKIQERETKRDKERRGNETKREKGGKKEEPGPVMVSATLCPVVHILRT